MNEALRVAAAWTAQAYLVDLDGTLIADRKPLPGAERLLALLGERVALVSNDAEHTPAQLARFLTRLGLAITADRIVLAGTAALDLIARDGHGRRLMLAGSTALRAYARHIGLEVVDIRPDVVLIARDRTFTYARLAATANAVRDGAELVVTNPDLVHPGRNGGVVPETGALLAAVLACAGPVPYRIIGKPEPDLFLRALDRLGARAADAAMIGDNPHTDGLGAQRLGIRFLAVEPGGLAPALAAMPFGRTGVQDAQVLARA